MASRFGRWLGVSGARAVAAAVGAVVVAGATLAAALGGEAGVPRWLRVVFGVLALVVAIVVVGLTVAERRSPGGRGRRRRRGWVEEHFGPRGRGVAHKGGPGVYSLAARSLCAAGGVAGPSRGGLCVVTGDPGSGKSAVLGRVVALADRGLDASWGWRVCRRTRCRRKEASTSPYGPRA